MISVKGRFANMAEAMDWVDSEAARHGGRVVRVVGSRAVGGVEVCATIAVEVRS